MPAPEGRRCAIPGREARLPKAVASPEVPQNRLFGVARRGWVAFERFSVDHGRTSPVGLSSMVARDAHAGNGGGRGLSRSIRRRISPNSARGTATSASWKTDVAAVAHDPGTDLHQLLAQGRQRPVLHLLG